MNVRLKPTIIALFLLWALLTIVAVFAQTTFRIMPETGGNYSSSIRLAPTYVNALVLAPGVSETFSVQATIRWMLFSSTCDFYAKTGATAAVPAADVTDGTASELNPSAWFVEGSTQVSVISASACTVTAAYYR